MSRHTLVSLRAWYHAERRGDPRTAAYIATLVRQGIESTDDPRDLPAELGQGSPGCDPDHRQSVLAAWWRRAEARQLARAARALRPMLDEEMEERDRTAVTRILARASAEGWL